LFFGRGSFRFLHSCMECNNNDSRGIVHSYFLVSVNLLQNIVRAGPHRASAFANRKAQPLSLATGSDQLQPSRLPLSPASLISVPSVNSGTPSRPSSVRLELSPYPLQTAVCPPALFLAQHVDFALTACAAWIAPASQSPARAPLVRFHSPQQQPHVVSGAPVV